MKSIIKIIHNQTIVFDFRKVVFWKETSSLILSDVHVGKITHFRKNGIPIPSFPSLNNLNILKYWNISPFFFSHFPVKDSKIFNLCGHIHPSFLLKGKGKQKIKLPCFYISKTNIIFPSFGEFTGTHNLKLENNGDEFILVSKNELFHLDSQS